VPSAPASDGLVYIAVLGLVSDHVPRDELVQYILVPCNDPIYIFPQ
jgi:hypothetical protein